MSGTERLYGSCELESPVRRTYLAATAPQQETRVVDAMRRAGFDVYLPREPKSVRTGHMKRRTIMRCMLPGYVFPIFNEERDQWKIIHDIDGVLRLFSCAERPLPIPQAAIDNIREREVIAEMRGKAKRSGVSGAMVAAPGAYVQIDDLGPWQGFIGQVIDLLARGTRIVVGIDVFGRQTPVEVSASQVRAV